MRTVQGGAEAEADDAEKLSESDLNKVYARLGCDPAELRAFDTPQPRSLKCTMHPYQVPPCAALGSVLAHGCCLS